MREPPAPDLRYGRSNLESGQETGQHEARQLVRVPPRPSATYNADQFQTICFVRHHHIREDGRDSGGVVLKQAQGFVAIRSNLTATADLFLVTIIATVRTRGSSSTRSTVWAVISLMPRMQHLSAA
jgi:hypothetical protein